MGNKVDGAALAKVGDDGHSFVFDDKPTGATLPPDSPGCGRPCPTRGGKTGTRSGSKPWEQLLTERIIEAEFEG